MVFSDGYHAMRVGMNGNIGNIIFTRLQKSPERAGNASFEELVADLLKKTLEPVERCSTCW